MLPVMSWLPESKDHLPLTWWKGTPVYLSAMLALAGAASMVLTAILMAAAPQVLEHLTFTVGDLTRFELWSPFTYVLVNPPSLWLLLGCYLLWRFGEAVERHLGRRSFVKLLLLLLLVSPALVSLLSFSGDPRACAGMMQVEFGIFLAFATLYPRAQISLIFFTLDVWVLAAVVVGVSALGDLAARDWVSLLLLAGNTGAAYGYIRLEQGAWKLPARPAFKIVPPPAASAERPAEPAKTARARRPQPGPAVDDILDKIGREGLHSLTDTERKILDEASADLQKRRG